MFYNLAAARDGAKTAPPLSSPLGIETQKNLGDGDGRKIGEEKSI